MKQAVELRVSQYVDFALGEFRVERQASDVLCDYEIRNAILQNLTSMVLSKCLYETCATNHTSADGYEFYVRTRPTYRLTEVYLA